MLYDQAQLACLYLHAWLATGEIEYRRVCEEILDYVGREMTHPEGGFYSSRDADSEGEEGKFFLWSPEEIRQILGDSEEAMAALSYWGVDLGPNFEGKSILYVPRDPAEVAAEMKFSPERLSELIAGARAKLYEAREKRVHPGRDEKVLASWNGMMCRVFAEAGRALGRANYTGIAVRNAEFLLSDMREHGRLLRSWKDGRAKLPAYLEDYAMVGDGCLAVYEATFNRRWLDEARQLADEVILLFWDESQEGFFDTGRDHEALVVRPRNLLDAAVPSGSSVAIELLLMLAVLTGEEKYERLALAALRPMADLMNRYPTGFGRWLCALDFHLGPVSEVALVWPRGSNGHALNRMIAEVFGRYLPNRVVAGCAEGDSAESAGIPLLDGRPAVQGKPTAYVCRRYVCQAPATDPETLVRQLAGEV